MNYNRDLFEQFKKLADAAKEDETLAEFVNKSKGDVVPLAAFVGLILKLVEEKKTLAKSESELKKLVRYD